MKRNLGLFSASVVISLLVLEILLRVFTQFPINETSNQIPDDELLYVMDPALPEIDRYGFRNSLPPEGADIIAIGDSHTYGFNVDAEDSWPARLGKLTGLKVYNYGIGGYNIYQYYRLFERALAYRPKYIVLGVYPANDFSSDICTVLRLPYWQGRRAELGLTDARCSGAPDAADGADSTQQEPFPVRAKRFLRFNVAILSAFDFLIWQPLQESELQQRREQAFSGSDAASRGEYLIISREHPELNLWRPSVEHSTSNVQPDDPVQQQHLANAKILFERMKRLADRDGVKLLALVVPSKERVIRLWAKRVGKATPPQLDQLASNEAYFIDAVIAEMRRLSVPTVDATDILVDALEDSLAKGERLYPLGDRHPYAPGYAAYADAVVKLFARDGMSQARTISP